MTATELLLTDAVFALFSTHPKPDALREAWKGRVAKLELVCHPSAKPNQAAQDALQLAKAMLDTIPTAK